MDVTFRFMNGANAFRAQVPDAVSSTGHVSVAVLNTIARTVCHLSTPLSNNIFQGKAPAGTVNTRSGNPILLYEQPSPPVQFLYWQVSDGFVWTWLDPEVDGDAGVQSFAQDLQVLEDELGPSIEMSGPLQGGDIRHSDEREEAMFYWTEGDILNAVIFTFAGPFAKDDEVGDENNDIVTIGTELGVNVTLDGPTSRRDELRALASQIAASVSAV